MNEQETPLRLCVVKLGDKYNPDDCDYDAIAKLIKDDWEKAWDGKPPMPIFVLRPGCDFTCGPC